MMMGDEYPMAGDGMPGDGMMEWSHEAEPWQACRPMYVPRTYPTHYLSMGAPVGYPMLARAVPTIDDILISLQRAHTDLALQCATASLGHFVPAIRRLAGFEELHRQNYEVAYHLTTAIGSARRILAGARDPGYFALLVSCQREAREHQEKAAAAYRRLAEAAPAEVRPLIQRMGGHIQATSGHLQRSIGLSTAALGRETIADLQRWTEQMRHD